MKPCWPDGDLRTYLDGEQSRELREEMAAHLDGCPVCAARCAELSDRAARVSGLLAMLPEGGWVAETPQARRPAPHRRQWAVAGLSLAAALALTFVMLPKHRAVVETAPVAQAATTPAPLEAAPPVRAPHAAVRRAVAPRQVTQGEFLRLDDDPIETGTVVRVSAENGDVQADLLMGPDGRAHAIRIVGNQ